MKPIPRAVIEWLMIHHKGNWVTSAQNVNEKLSSKGGRIYHADELK